MPDDVLVRDGPVAVPLSYTVPQSGEMLPLMVRAIVDGTAAAASFYAAVQLVAPSGRIMGSSISSAIAAGASADVTWFPGPVGASTAAALSVVGARIYDSGVQTIPNSTRTDITFDTVDFDTSGMANLGSNNKILTCQVAGFYQVECNVFWLNSYLGIRVLHLTLNGLYSAASGTTIAADEIPITSDQPQPTSCSALVELAVGDFVSVGVRQTSLANLATTGTGAANKYSHALSAVLQGVP